MAFNILFLLKKIIIIIIIDLIGSCDSAEMKGTAFSNDLVLNLEGSEENSN